MGWTLVKEIGVAYPPVREARPEESLRFPAFVERAPDGTYLIVDELDVQKGVPMRAEYRTLRVDADHHILYDSCAQGIEDGYGCLMENGVIALLRTTRWEVWILSAAGAILDKIALFAFSKRMPTAISWTWNRTFLVTFVDKVFDVDVVEFDMQGRLLWYLPLHGRKIGCPHRAQLLWNRHVLFADEFCHIAAEVDGNGHVIWQFGEWRSPADSADHLSSPRSIHALADGTRLIADTRNHRVLILRPGGSVDVMQSLDDAFCTPTSVAVAPDGNYLIGDAGNGRVVELNVRGQVVWQFGRQAACRRWFSFPRSLETTPDGGLLVCDTAHNRIVEIRDDQCREWPFEDATPLFWPRSARVLPSGSLLIADGRNSRIVEVSPQGRVLRQLSRLDISGSLPLKDPHDVRLLPNGNLLIVDPSHDLVVEADWQGHAHRVIGDGEVDLDDPHSAQWLPDDTVLISDSGHHRLVSVDRNGHIVRECERLCSGASRFRLNRPRYAEVFPPGILVVVDTGNNRILAADTTGELLWELSEIPGSYQPYLDQPRWAYLLEQNEVLVCDHYQHRILHMQYEPDSSGPAAP